MYSFAKIIYTFIYMYILYMKILLGGSSESQFHNGHFLKTKLGRNNENSIFYL